MRRDSTGPGTRPTRRSVLLAAAVAPMAGCSAFGGGSAAPPVEPRPDQLLRERVELAEEQMVALYRSTATAHPDLAERLATFRARHEQHLAAVAAALSTGTSTEASAGAATEASGTQSSATPEPTTASLPPVPADRAAAIQALRDAEEDAADERLSDCLTAADGELARVLAGIAACEATHQRLLSGLSA